MSFHPTLQKHYTTKNSDVKYAGNLILLLGPAGVGKSTVLRHLQVDHPELVYPRSVTTRLPRPNERHGETYFFVSEAVFAEYTAKELLLESTVVHGHDHYGMLKSEVLEPLLQGKTVVREIDIQGLKKLCDVGLKPLITSIFLYPPSIETLRERIIHRAPISPDELNRRLQSAQRELAEKDLCQHHILCPDGAQEVVYAQVLEIIRGQKK